MRFVELKKHLGCTAKVLTNCLKELEEAGYQGSKGGSGSSTPTGFGKKGSGKMSPVVDDDDDIPF